MFLPPRFLRSFSKSRIKNSEWHILLPWKKNQLKDDKNVKRNKALCKSLAIGQNDAIISEKETGKGI